MEQQRFDLSAEILTVHALQRVLFHLSEDQQAPQPRGSDRCVCCIVARAQARVTVKRLLREAESIVGLSWQAAKDA